jgi:hypothetical protein
MLFLSSQPNVLIVGGVYWDRNPPQSMDVDSDEDSLMPLQDPMDWDEESVFMDHDANDTTIVNIVDLFLLVR